LTNTNNQVVNQLNVDQASIQQVPERRIDDRDPLTGVAHKTVWRGNEEIDGMWKDLTTFLRLTHSNEVEGSKPGYRRRFLGECPIGCGKKLCTRVDGGPWGRVDVECRDCYASGETLVREAFRGYVERHDVPDKPTELDFNTDTDGKRTYRTYTLDDIETFSDIKWLVQNVLQCSTSSLLYGDSNTGKTFIGLDIALRMAMGMTWQGRKVQAGRVLYIYAEGKLGLKPRWQAWKKHFNGTATDNISFIPCPVHLIGNKDELTRTVESLPDKPVLVIVDTFSMCAPDTNENAANEVSRVLEVANYIKRTYSSHVMIVHHAGKNGDYRGSAAFKGNIDTMIELKRDDNDSPICLHCKKQRDGSYFNDIWLELKTVEIGYNETTMEPITSCVVVGTDKRDREHTGTLSQQLLSILVEAGNNGLTYTEWLQLSGLKKNQFNENRTKLVGLSEVTLYADKRYRAN
jgi:hypothetical protein